jgi:hypothetical protein
MRMFRLAAVAVLLAIPVVVAATPAAYAGTASAGRPARDDAADEEDGSTAFATPANVTPGSRVTFTVNCDQGLNAGAASAILIGTTLGLPARIPMNAINGSLFDFNVTVILPRGIVPGSYDPVIDCPGGVEPATAPLVVTAVPSGGAATGDGTTSTATDSRLAMAGLAMIGVGALAGGFALRRRTVRPRG